MWFLSLIYDYYWQASRLLADALSMIWVLFVTLTRTNISFEGLQLAYSGQWSFLLFCRWIWFSKRASAELPQLRASRFYTRASQSYPCKHYCEFLFLIIPTPSTPGFLAVELLAGCFWLIRCEISHFSHWANSKLRYLWLHRVRLRCRNSI